MGKKFSGVKSAEIFVDSLSKRYFDFFWLKGDDFMFLI